MDFAQAIAKTINDLQANPVWQREALIGQGIDPLHANVMAQKAGEDQERKQMVAMIRARIDAGQPITESELLAIGSVNPDLARMVIQMQEPKKPNNQYMLDPNTGKVVAVNKDTGMAGYAPFGDYSGAGEMSMGAPDGLPSLDAVTPPQGLSPVGEGAFNKQAGKLAAEKQAGAGKAATKTEEALEKNESLTSKIDKVISQVNETNFATGGIGSVMKDIPGTKAHDILSNIDTIRANLGFDKLQNMRDNSPTGGALGQVSENENKLLQKAAANLEQSQSREQFVANLESLKKQYAQSTERLKRAYMKDYGTLEGFDFGDTVPLQPQQPDFGGFKILGVE